jgi:hypothetical protein
MILVNRNSRLRTSNSSASENDKAKLEAQLKKEVEKRDKALNELQLLEAPFKGTDYDKTVSSRLLM